MGIQGLMIEPLIKFFKIKLQPTTKKEDENILTDNICDTIKLSELALQAILGHDSQHTKATKFREKYDYLLATLYKRNFVYENPRHERLEMAYRKSWRVQKLRELEDLYDLHGRKFRKHANLGAMNHSFEEQETRSSKFVVSISNSNESSSSSVSKRNAVAPLEIIDLDKEP